MHGFRGESDWANKGNQWVLKFKKITKHIIILLSWNPLFYDGYLSFLFAATPRLPDQQKSLLQATLSSLGSQVALVVKNLPANAGDTRDIASIPMLRRSPGGGNGIPPQYSCLENSMGQEAWQVTVHGVAKSQTWLNTCFLSPFHSNSDDL